MPVEHGARRAERRLPLGAEPLALGGVHFRVWAPRYGKMTVIVFSATAPQQSIEIEMESGQDGYFTACSAEAKPGDLYRWTGARIRCRTRRRAFSRRAPSDPP